MFNPFRRETPIVLFLLCALGLMPWAAWAQEDDAALSAARGLLEPVLQPRGASVGELSWAQAGPMKAIKAVITFKHTDPRGDRQEAKGKIFLPTARSTGQAAKFPLAYQAGYEVADAVGILGAHLGMVVATPMGHPLNPLSRGPGLDIALLHIARALPVVDDAKVLVSGGSAGGYTTLMLAAETFPLNGAAPGVPPVNFGYNIAFFAANHELLRTTLNDKGQPTTPVLAGVSGMLVSQIYTYYPKDHDDPVWYELSPIAHLDRITCPVSVSFSTGDILVPIDQVAADLKLPYEASLFPDGFRIATADLMKSDHGKATLLDALPKEDYTLTHVTLPPEAVLLTDAKPGMTPPTVTAPIDASKRWNIMILDEGPIRPMGNHFQRAFKLDNNQITARLISHPIDASQLTARKLQTLMDRYAGRQWMSATLKHLDAPEAEKVDVLRGLITYVSQGESHARTLLDLYAKLPDDRKALGPLSAELTREQLTAHLQKLNKPALP